MTKLAKIYRLTIIGRGCITDLVLVTLTHFFFKIIFEFILKMMLSLEPIDGIISPLTKVHLFDKDIAFDWFG